MALLADYVITPDVFDTASYATADECAARIESIREVMLTEGLVRDLRDGAWHAIFEPGIRGWHPRGMELTRKLAKRGRLVASPPALPHPPDQDTGWCAEAVASHASRALAGGVIATRHVKVEFADEPLVGRIDRLGSTPWWASRSPSVRPARTLADYEVHLAPVLGYSNSLMFIDPHLDPEKQRYRDLATLLRRAGRRTPPPLIEIHRVCYEGSGSARKLPMRDDREHFRRRFRDRLGAPLLEAGLEAEVFIWDDFHDRYLISNLIGISLSNGFDTSRAPDARCTWTRLGTKDRDEVQREFDGQGRRHKLLDHFRIL